MTIAQGKRGTSAALGWARKMISCFFLRFWRASCAPKPKEKRSWVGWPFTQGGGLGGLALGYYQAAPSGLRKEEKRDLRGPEQHQAVNLALNQFKAGERSAEQSELLRRKKRRRSVWPMSKMRFIFKFELDRSLGH